MRFLWGRQLCFQRYARAVIIAVGVAARLLQNAVGKAVLTSVQVLCCAIRANDIRPVDSEKAGSLPVFLSVCPCLWMEDAHPAL